MAQQIFARLIVEMMGKPKEYIEKTLRQYIGKFKEKLDIVKEEYVKPKEVEGGLFSTFVELEIKFKDIEELFGFLLDAMPSSIEIMEPENLSFAATNLSNFLNDIQQKLHTTDMLVKTLSAQNKNLDKNATTVFHNFLIHLIGEGDKTIDQLSPHMGVQPAGLKPFLDYLISQKKVVQKGDVYKPVR